MSILINFLILLIILMPKITIISISGSSTGIRLEDLLILIVCTLIFAYNHGNSIISSKHLKKISLIFLIFTFFGMISCTLGVLNGYVNMFKSIIFLVRKIEYFAFIFLGFYYAKHQKLEYIFDMAIIFHFIISIGQGLGVIGSFSNGKYLNGLTQGRISSFFSASYEYGAFFLMILPVYVENLIEKKNIKKNLLLTLIITLCIIICKSRTSLIFEIIIILIILKNHHIFSSKKIFLGLFISLLLFIPTVLVFINNSNSRFKSLNLEGMNFIINYTWENKDFDSYIKEKNWYGIGSLREIDIEKMGYDASFFQRISHWFQMIDGLTKKGVNLIFGLGVSVSGNSADGNYIRLLVENGLIGLIIFLILLKIMLKTLSDSQEYGYYKYSLLTVIFGAVVIDLFEASKIMMLVWFIIGYIIQKNEEGEQNATKKYSSS